jgi:hypothetical protein
MNRRSLIALGVGLVLVLAILAVDVVAPPPPVPTSPDAAQTAAVTPVAGSATCAVGDGREGSEFAVSAARPGDVGERPAEVEIVSFEDGNAERSGVPPVFPGVHARTAVEGGETRAAGVTWRGGPVAVQREWRLEGNEDLPPGTVAGACPTSVAERYVIPGMITVGGSEARIRLANPFATDATIAVGFVTPEGPERPLALQNLSVPAHGTLEVDVNEILPERADLSAVIRVLSGRAIAEGYQLTRSAIGDIDGASLLAASTGPAETWTIPWVTDGDGDEAWLWVVNLGDRPAPVELTLHTADGGIPPEGLSEVTVAPGQLRRVDLRGTLPEGVGAAAVTARSDGAPIHVSGVVQRRAEAVEDTGFAVQLGVPEPDESWVVSGGAIGEGRRERLWIVNRDSEPADLSIALFNGSTVLRPGELSGLRLGPGESQQFILDELAGASSWSAFVTSTAPVVVGRVGAGAEGAGLHLVATPGVPAASWGPTTLDLPVRAAPGAVLQLGTAYGIRPDDPFAEAGEPSPSPEPPSPDEDADTAEEEAGDEGAEDIDEPDAAGGSADEPADDVDPADGEG